MRWSRHHDDTSLGELMDSQPDTSDDATVAGTSTSSPSAGSTSEEETQVRLSPGNYLGGSTITSYASDDEVTTEVAAADGSDSFLDDEDYLPQDRRGPGRLTVALVAALVLTVGVLGGVWVEKQLGSTTSAAGRGMSGGAGGQGFPAGGTGGQGMPGGGTGGQGVPGGAPSSSAGTETGAGGGSPSGSTPATPLVVGTVASSSTKSLVVSDLGGTRHTVAVTSTTTVTTPYGHGSLEAGDTVSVTGTTTSDGSVTATGVTVS